MDLSNPQITLRQARIEQLETELAKEREKVKLKEKQISDLLAEVVFEVSTPRIRELEDELAAAQATIAEMQRILRGIELYRARNGDDWPAVEARKALSLPTNLDALHEARALECERLAAKRRLMHDTSTAMLLDIEAAAHRAKKGEGK